MSNPIHVYNVDYPHRGSIYLGIIGFTSPHLSLAERAIIRERGDPDAPPSPSSVGSGVYSADDAMKVSSSSPSSLGTDDGCGRSRK